MEACCLVKETKRLHNYQSFFIGNTAVKDSDDQPNQSMMMSVNIILKSMEKIIVFSEVNLTCLDVAILSGFHFLF